jgi:hypothetical protein
MIPVNVKRFFRVFSIAFVIALLAVSTLASPVLAVSITLTPSQGHPLSTVTITGSFSTSGSATISFDGAVIGSATVTSGSISGSFQVPLKPRGVYPVVAQIVVTESATAQFTITPRINLSASAGYVGDQITVTGNGFSPSPVSIYFDNSTTPLANTTANASGILAPVTITIPAATKASHVIKAVDAAGSANAAFASFAVSPRMTLSPSAGGAGDQITATGTGFAGSSSINITIDGEEVSTSPPSVSTDNKGGFTAGFVIPADTSRGAHSIIATDLMDNSAAAVLTVEDKITLSASSGFVGDTIEVSGTGFAANKTVTLYFDTTVIPTTNLRTNSSGAFPATTITIPAAAKGSHTIKARDADDNQATTGFTVNSKVTTNKDSGPVGTEVTISGSGFAASSVVIIFFDTDSQGTTQTDASGSFSNVNLNVPASVKGSHTIKARDADDNQATTGFTVNSKVITNKDSGPVGTEVTISGSGFAASSVVIIFFDTDSQGTTQTNASGSFSNVNLNVPASVKGNHTIKARDADDNQATTGFTVNSKITLNTNSGVSGDAIVINGTGFAASTQSALNTITLTLDGTYPLTPVGTGVVTTDDKGTFTATFTTPGVVNGEHIVLARDAAGNTAQTILAVEQKISLSAITGGAGDQVNLLGAGFAASKQITIKYDGKVISTAPATVTTDANGSFSANIIIPATIAGTYKVEASDGTNAASENFVAKAVATIDKTTSQSSPGFVGMDITINGAGFKAYATITVTFESTPIQIATAQSDVNGSFSVTFKIPAATAGEHTIKLSDGTTTREFPFIMESTAPVAPSLLLPANSSKPKQPVIFSWNGVSDPSGVVYDLQLGTDASFTTLVLEQKALTGVEYTIAEGEKLPSVSSKAPYYWRVRAVDGAGNAGAWAAAGTFVVGFIWPGWLTHLLYGIGIVVVLYIGMRIGARIAYRSSNEYQ